MKNSIIAVFAGLVIFLLSLPVQAVHRLMKKEGPLQPLLPKP